MKNGTEVQGTVDSDKRPWGKGEKSEKYFQGELIGLMVSAHVDKQGRDNEGDASASRWGK